MLKRVSAMRAMTVILLDKRDTERSIIVELFFCVMLVAAVHILPEQS